MACLAASVVATFSAMSSLTRLTSMTNCLTSSLSADPVLVVRESVVPDLAGCPLAATDTPCLRRRRFNREDVKPHSKGADGLLELSNLIFEMLLLCLERCAVASDVLDDLVLLCYRLLQARDELCQLAYPSAPSLRSSFRGDGYAPRRKWR